MSLLDDLKNSDEAGRYPTDAEYDTLSSDPHLAPRARAAREAQSREREVVKTTVDWILKKYPFEAHHGAAREKCYRDVGAVFRWGVFSMLCDDIAMYDNKLLLWMRTIIQAFNFPSGNESIRATYSLLRKEARKQLTPQTAALMDPFLERAEIVLAATTAELLASRNTKAPR
jgi:hypothetical protein